MKIIFIVKEIKVRGYYRKSGVWVSPHIRIIKVKPTKDNIKIRFSNKSYDNPNQLKFNFPPTK